MRKLHLNSEMDGSLSFISSAQSIRAIMLRVENWEDAVKGTLSLSQIRLPTLISPRIERKQSWFCFLESRKTTET